MADRGLEIFRAATERVSAGWHESDMLKPGVIEAAVARMKAPPVMEPPMIVLSPQAHDHANRVLGREPGTPLTRADFYEAATIEWEQHERARRSAEAARRAIMRRLWRIRRA